MIICCYTLTSLALTLAHERLNQTGLAYIAYQACAVVPCALSAKGIRLRVTKGEARMRHHH